MRHVRWGAWLFGTLVVALALGMQAESEQTSAEAVAADDPVLQPSEVLPLARQSLILDIARIGDRAVAVGERGHILLSDDLQQWRQVLAPTRATLTAVTGQGSLMWAVGHDEVILRSLDGGLTWTLEHYDITAMGPLLDVLFLDADRGFAVGAYGRFLSTTDGGDHWTVEYISDRQVGAFPPLPEAEDDVAEEDNGELASTDIGEEEGDPHLNAIVRSRDGLLIVGEAGKGYRSVDDGATWTPWRMPYSGSMFAAVVLEDQRILAFGLRGNALTTADLGRSWQEFNTGTQSSLMGGAVVPGRGAVLVGASGAVVLVPKGDAHGRLFTFDEGGVLAGVLPKGERDFVVVGENGILDYSPQ